MIRWPRITVPTGQRTAGSTRACDRTCARVDGQPDMLVFGAHRLSSGRDELDVVALDAERRAFG